MKKLLALTLVSALAVSACNEDKAVDAVKDAAKTATDTAKTAVTEAGDVAVKGADAVKDAVEKVAAYSNEKDQLGYAFGYQFAKNLAQNELQGDISAAGLKDAIDDVLSGKDARMTDQEMGDAVQAFRDRKLAEAKVAAEESKKVGDDFLAANKLKEGIVTTESGLQYSVQTEGKGAAPEDGNSVEVHYKGTLIDGKVFDSSYDRGQPATFPVSGVIPGFTEGLKLMKEGGKNTFYIPSGLAYGENAPPSIGANQALIFEVELIKVK